MPSNSGSGAIRHLMPDRLSARVVAGVRRPSRPALVERHRRQGTSELPDIIRVDTGLVGRNHSSGTAGVNRNGARPPPGLAEVVANMGQRLANSRPEAPFHLLQHAANGRTQPPAVPNLIPVINEAGAHWQIMVQRTGNAPRPETSSHRAPHPANERTQPRALADQKAVNDRAVANPPRQNSLEFVVHPSANVVPLEFVVHPSVNVVPTSQIPVPVMPVSLRVNRQLDDAPRRIQTRSQTSNQAEKRSNA